MNNATRIFLIIVIFNLGGIKKIKEKKRPSLRSLFNKERKIFRVIRFRSLRIKINLILDAFYFLATAVLRKRKIIMKIIVRSIRTIKAFSDIIFLKSKNYILYNSMIIYLLLYINFNKLFILILIKYMY